MAHHLCYLVGCIVLISFIDIETVSAQSSKEENSTLCLPIPDDCSFYRRCLEAKVPCGDNGYALGFGQYYCNIFREKNDRFSAAGQEWIQSVMYCLQEVLVPFANGKEITDCAGIRSFAFASHYCCYINPGNGFSICTIPWSDWIKLFIIIVRELKDLTTWKLMLEITRTCSS